MSPGHHDSDRPRLLLATPYFRPTHYGGAVQVYHQLLSHLQLFDAVVISQRWGGDAAEMEKFDGSCAAEYGYRTQRIGRYELIFPRHATLPERLADSFRFFRRTTSEWRATVRLIDPDVVVCGATLAAGWMMSRTPGSLPFVNYLHGEELATGGNIGFVRRYMFRQQLAAIRNADVNISVSRYTAGRACELAGIPQERVVLLPNFVDINRFSPPADREGLRRRLGWQDQHIILTLSRLTPRKGIDQAIQSLAQLRQAGQLPPHWRHIIAGRGEQESELRALVARVGAGGYTRFEGFVDHDQVPLYYGAADIFLQPNRDLSGDTEGFGVVFLEASACGTPVIGGTAGGTADAIREGVTGFRVDSEDITAIGQAVLRLVRDEDLRQSIGITGSEIVRREHRLEAAVKRFEELLLEVVKARPVSRERPTQRGQP